MKKKPSKRDTKPEANVSNPNTPARSTKDPEKLLVQQKNPPRYKAVTLVLTPALVHDAMSLVSIYDDIDWEQVSQTQCDTVHLQFQSDADVKTANIIFLEMAA